MTTFSFANFATHSSLFQTTHLLSWFWLLIWKFQSKRKIFASKNSEEILNHDGQYITKTFHLSKLCSKMNLLCLCNFVTKGEQCSSLVSLAVAFAAEVKVIKTSKVRPTWCNLQTPFSLFEHQTTFDFSV